MFRTVRLLILPILCALTALTSCSDDMPRQEAIEKLRGIGVEQSPVSAKPGSVVTLTFHMLSLQSETITGTPYLDSISKYSVPTKVTLLDTNATEEKLGKISAYSFRAQYTVPSDAATVAALAVKSPSRVRYGVTFNNGSKTETMVGDILVYKEGSAELAWTAPTISIDQPLATTISSSTSISSTLQNSNPEKNQISWFVSTGKVKNRQAKSTDWSEISSGDQTLVVTSRGKSSGAFAMKVLKVTVQ